MGELSEKNEITTKSKIGLLKKANCLNTR